MEPLALIAGIRFGLGPRPDQAPPDDPRAWLLRQLEGPDAPPPVPEGWPAPPDALEGLALWREEQQNPPAPGIPYRRGRLFVAEQAAWLGRCIVTDTPFRERLLAFWTNHFTVSRREGLVTVLAAPFLREAIRPHVLGRFADMVVAAERHPAMLYYLNQNSSIGPDSPWGRRSGRGLNENLAREILELHTLSPAGGYTQQDVTEFAKLLTGLSVEGSRDPLGPLFRPANHQPGAKTILGRRFEPGEASIDVALRWLAGHPATHRHLALKLARHFVADEPPPEAVAVLEGVLRDTDGDLAAAARALVGLEAAWSPPLSKLRAPQDLAVAAFRALGATAADGDRARGMCDALGQPVWVAPQPNGWPDRAADWASPEGVLQRLDQMHGLSGRYARVGARDSLELALGPLARPETRTAVLRAGSNRDGLTLLLGSPEFQRR
ncbi:DUF1800 domain-containing protein [Roseomonas sp. OT10]|uniref:DUF1800 domain-containing protein n=1 Tax=Roseomonas cutis TaxID=2897332 RepID=UPI001E551CC7|nr:DUF1800 domain-containing protein [Roseomonas sp. OT10]UFN48822.1 DUF1800 domain-containing protein [Roseomonas sp. OT10]